jgi:hypothetical protein
MRPDPFSLKQRVASRSPDGSHSTRSLVTTRVGVLGSPPVPAAVESSPTDPVDPIEETTIGETNLRADPCFPSGTTGVGTFLLPEIGRGGDKLRPQSDCS